MSGKEYIILTAVIDIRLSPETMSVEIVENVRDDELFLPQIANEMDVDETVYNVRLPCSVQDILDLVVVQSRQCSSDCDHAKLIRA